ncbi:MAG: Lin0512 family protein [Pikeienuella sp.]
MKRIMLELGSGADLHGGDQTKAARRAVEDALRRSSLSIFRSLGLDPQRMRVEITIGAPDPAGVDAAAIAAIPPYGAVEVTVVKGGLSAAGLGGPDGSAAVIAAAAIAVHVEIPEGRWRLV